MQNNMLNYSFIYIIQEIAKVFKTSSPMLYLDSGISMDEEIVLGDMIWSYNKGEL